MQTMGDTIKQVANAVATKADDLAASVGIKDKGNGSGASAKSDKKALLGYWNIRGLAGYLRLMLNYCNEPYEEKIYSDMPQTMDQAKEMRAKHEGSQWYKEKVNTGMDFPNIPYLYIDGLRMSQSRAILRYLARKHTLDGKTEKAKYDIDMVDETVKDFLMWHAMMAYMTPKSQYEAARKNYIEQTLPENLGLLSKYLESRQYVAGDYVTYADFPLYEYLDIQRMFAPEVVNKYHNLTLYLKRVEELPAIKEYMQSSRCIRAPVFMPFALWDGSSFAGVTKSGPGGAADELDTSLNLTATKMEPSMAASFSD